MRTHKLGTELPTLVKRAQTAPVWCLDDLGWEAPRHCETVFDILDARYREGLTTLITSGLTVEQLIERYSDAGWRRMRDGATVINCHSTG